MTKQLKAMKMALEALETCDAAHPADGGYQWYDDKAVDKAITALREAIEVAEGYVLVPVEPTPDQWGGLARDIILWMQITPAPHYGSKLHTHLRKLDQEIPVWLAEEIPDIDHTPAKGTIAACIYKAMLAAAQKGITK